MTLPELSRYPIVSIDTETDGLLWWENRPFALVWATPDGNSGCEDLRDGRVLSWARRELPKLNSYVGHNLKFDIHMLREKGIHLPVGRAHDTMVAAALIDEHLPAYDLDYVGKKYVGVGKAEGIYEKLAAIFGGKPTRNAQMGNLHKAPWSLVQEYAIPDAVTTLKLWQWQAQELERQDLIEVYEVERHLMWVLVDIEHRGVRVDIEGAEKAAKSVDKMAGDTQRELNKLAGRELNVNSNKQLREMFKPENVDDQWVLVDGTVADKTEGGGPSLNGDVLRRMKHPGAAQIIKLRQLIRTRDTFLRGHILGHHHDGIIHANFNQTKTEDDLGTGTGRLSCNSPALQQIHKRNKEIASVVRALFIPDEGHEWHCHDWAQMDFRVFAHYAANPKILAMYNTNPDSDFHQITADMTGLPRSMTPGIKGNAKQVNLGLVFGMGEGKLAMEMGLPYTMERDSRGREWAKPGDEAKAVFATYHDNVPGVRELLDKASSVARSRGYVRTALGRRIRFPGGMFVHKAGGLIFQGSAADALKVKLVEVHKRLRTMDNGSRLVLNVHDEFDISCPHEHRESTRDNVQRIIRHFDGVGTPIKFDVPIMSDFGVGLNWWEASK